MQDRLQFPAQLLRCAVIDKLRCGCCAQPFERQLRIQTAPGHFRCDAVPRADASNAGFIRCRDKNQYITALFKRRADNDCTVHKGELRPCQLGVRQRSINTAQDFPAG